MLGAIVDKLMGRKSERTQFRLQQVVDRFFVLQIMPVVRNGHIDCPTRVTEYISDYLNTHKRDNYIVFNFTPVQNFGERFDGQVMRMPRIDSTTEDFHMLLQFCITAHQWLVADKNHIVVIATLMDMDCSLSNRYVDCAAMVTACYMYFSGHGEEEPNLIGLLERKQLTLSVNQRPSQSRYLEFFKLLLELPDIPNTHRLRLMRLSVHDSPLHRDSFFALQVECQGRIVFEAENDRVSFREIDGHVLDFDIDCSVFGDFFCNHVALRCYSSVPEKNLFVPLLILDCFCQQTVREGHEKTPGLRREQRLAVL
eukprot:PhM_4_TR2715/c0_g1_i1/m.22619